MEEDESEDETEPLSNEITEQPSDGDDLTVTNSDKTGTETKTKTKKSKDHDEEHNDTRFYILGFRY